MNRRRFLAFLSTLPFLGFLKPKPQMGATSWSWVTDATDVGTDDLIYHVLGSNEGGLRGESPVEQVIFGDNPKMTIRWYRIKEDGSYEEISDVNWDSSCLGVCEYESIPKEE